MSSFKWLKRPMPSQSLMLNVTEGFAGTRWLSVKIRATINGKGLTPFQTLQYLKINTEKLYRCPDLRKGCHK